MKQIVQSARSGELQLVDVPAPAPERGQLLIQNQFSVMSPGTEKLSMDFAQKSLLGKARSRPDLVSQVLKKVRQEGPLPTLRTVVNRVGLGDFCPSGPCLKETRSTAGDWLMIRVASRPQMLARAGLEGFSGAPQFGCLQS